MALPLFTADERFEEDRKANDQRLKSRFEHIFSKYERDFTGIGDEIDLTTGEIIVDNGHIASLQFKIDIGAKAASTFIDSFAHEHAEDTPVSQDEDDEVPDVPEEDEDDPLLQCSLQGLGNDTRDLSGSSEYSSSGVLTDDEAAEDVRAPLTPRIVRAASQAPGSQIRALKNIPGVIRDSLMAMRHKDGPFDKDAIDRIESQIAGEVARLLAKSQPSQEYEPAKDPKWDYPELPARKRQRSESPAGLTSRPALSSSAALFTKSPKGTPSWPSERANKRHCSSSPSTEGDVSNAQAKFMSVVRAHATSHQGFDTPDATHAGSFFEQANTARRILPKPVGGPTIEQQYRAHAEFVAWNAQQQPYMPWRTGRRLRWADDVPSFRDEPNERLDYRPLAPKAMLQAAPKPQGQKPAPRPYAGPVSDMQAMKELQKKHVYKLDEKRYRVPHAYIEEDHEGGPRPFYTVEEDALLLKMRYEQGLDWDIIMNKMPGRTQVSLYNRFAYIRRLMLPDMMPQAKTKADLPLISSEEAIAQLTRSGPMQGRVEYLRRLFSLGENGRTLLETVDLEAMPVPEYRGDFRSFGADRTGAFSEKEDRLIARLRDKEQMLFEEMVPYLRGRDAQSIAERYYDYILGRPAQPSATTQADTTQTCDQDVHTRSVDLDSTASADDDLDDDPQMQYEAATPSIQPVQDRMTTTLLPSSTSLPVTRRSPTIERRPIPRLSTQLEQRRSMPSLLAASLVLKTTQHCTLTEQRPTPRPSRFSGSGRNPFLRPHAHTPAQMTLAAKPVVRTTLSTSSIHTALANTKQTLKRPSMSQPTPQSLQQKPSISRPPLQPSQQRPAATTHLSQQASQRSTTVSDSHSGRMSLPLQHNRGKDVGELPDNTTTHPIAHVSFVDRGIHEVPNSTAQSEWTALSQSSITSSTRLLQQRPLRPPPQRRRSAGDQVLEVKALAQQIKSSLMAAHAASATRDSSTSSKHDSFFDMANDGRGPLPKPVQIVDDEYASSPGAVEYGEPQDNFEQLADPLGDFEDSPEPLLPEKSPVPPTPPPQEQLLHLTRDLFRDHAKHVARRRRDIVWHSSDSEDGSDYAPERVDVLEYEENREVADDQAEIEKYEKARAAAKLLAERATLLSKPSNAKTKHRKSLPADLDRWSSEPPSSSAESSPQKLQQPVREKAAPQPAPTTKTATRPVPKQKPAPRPRRSLSPDMPQENRRVSLPTKLPPKSSTTTLIKPRTAVPSKVKPLTVRAANVSRITPGDLSEDELA